MMFGQLLQKSNKFGKEQNRLISLNGREKVLEIKRKKAAAVQAIKTIHTAKMRYRKVKIIHQKIVEYVKW